LRVPGYRRPEFAAVPYFWNWGRNVAAAESLRLDYDGDGERDASQIAFGFDLDPPLPSATAGRGDSAGPPVPLELDTGFSDDEREEGESAAPPPPPPPLPRPEQVRPFSTWLGGSVGARRGNCRLRLSKCDEGLSFCDRSYCQAPLGGALGGTEEVIQLLVAIGLVASVEEGRRMAAEGPGVLEEILMEQQVAALREALLGDSEEEDGV
jgi:hypothetical protein